jgi:hypothetical protein
LVYIARATTGLVEVYFGPKATDLRRSRKSVSPLLPARPDEVIE